MGKCLRCGRRPKKRFYDNPKLGIKHVTENFSDYCQDCILGAQARRRRIAKTPLYERNCYLRSEAEWNAYLDSLRAYLEDDSNFPSGKT